MPLQFAGSIFPLVGSAWPAPLPSPLMTSLYLIRHGDNDYVGKKLAGWTPGVHLNDKGRQQAEALAERLAPVRFKAIYSSPLERTLESARPLARAQDLRIQKREDLGEVHYGEWTGKSLRALSRTKLWRVVQFNPSNMRFPQGEALRETQVRATGALDEICHAHPKGAVAIFSHGDVIRLCVAHFMGLGFDLFQRIQINPASVSVIQVGAGYPPRVARLNDTGPFEAGS
jgi:probable phosphomutase (TIGR03848 family)